MGTTGADLLFALGSREGERTRDAGSAFLGSFIKAYAPPSSAVAQIVP